MQDVSSILQLSTTESTQNMLDNIQVVLSEILHNDVHHLHNIKHYPRYGVSITRWIFFRCLLLTHDITIVGTWT